MMEALSQKVLILGIDGMDPVQTKKYVQAGLMPNLEKFLERGAYREDLHMIGGQPTVTPPMWTTLGTGAYPSTHGITDFYARSEDLDVVVYNFDSRKCKAEHIWDAVVESGKKALVWHWVGAGWPPTSSAPNLHVVDGTQPTGVNIGVAEVDSEKIVIASEQTTELLYKDKLATDSKTPCYISGMVLEERDPNQRTTEEVVHSEAISTIAISPKQAAHHNMCETPLDTVFSPIKTAEGWSVVPPAGTKECTLLSSGGLIHRPCQILQNEAGIYDRVAVFKNKKATEPLAILPKDAYINNIVDEVFQNDRKIETTNRSMRVLELAEDGSALRLWMSPAMDYSIDALFSPQSLYQELLEHVGYPQPNCMAAGFDEKLIRDCLLASWEKMDQWNAAGMKYLMKQYDYSLVVSHFHNVDMIAHMLVADLKGSAKITAELAQQLYQEIYIQTDGYIGQFLELLDEGWSIMIVSDHGLVCPEHGQSTLYNGENACNAIYFKQWGYTVLKRDEQGQEIGEIDWERTTAVTNRINHIYVNLKGREKHGIVAPEDQFELEERIMTDLYSLKDPVTGHRVVALALRNKDAILLGQGGPDSGDIVYYLAEGYNGDHADCLSTTNGVCDTSCASVFMAAGAGIKHTVIDRVVRHVDVTPTAAMLLGIRMPHQCEGAPVYQILDGNFA